MASVIIGDDNVKLTIAFISSARIFVCRDGFEERMTKLIFSSIGRQVAQQLCCRESSIGMLRIAFDVPLKL